LEDEDIERLRKVLLVPGDKASAVSTEGWVSEQAAL